MKLQQQQQQQQFNNVEKIKFTQEESGRIDYPKYPRQKLKIREINENIRMFENLMPLPNLLQKKNPKKP